MTQRRGDHRQHAKRLLQLEFPDTNERILRETLEAHDFSLSECRESLSRLHGLKDSKKPKHRFKFRWPKIGGGGGGGYGGEVRRSSLLCPPPAIAVPLNNGASRSVLSGFGACVGGDGVGIEQKSDMDYHLAVQRQSLERVATVRTSSAGSLTQARRAVKDRRELLLLLLEHGAESGAALFEAARQTLLGEFRLLNRQWTTQNSGPQQHQQQQLALASPAVSRRKHKCCSNSHGEANGPLQQQRQQQQQMFRHQRVSASLFPMAAAGAPGVAKLPPPLYRPASVPQEPPQPPARPWQCERCTFENHPDMEECEMCSALRPGTQMRPRSVSISLDRPLRNS